MREEFYGRSLDRKIFKSTNFALLSRLGSRGIPVLPTGLVVGGAIRALTSNSVCRPELSFEQLPWQQLPWKVSGVWGCIERGKPNCFYFRLQRKRLANVRCGRRRYSRHTRH